MGSEDKYFHNTGFMSKRKNLKDLTKSINDFGEGTVEQDKDTTKMHGDTGDGPYIQFESCRHGDEFECKFKDTSGKCIFETCVMDNHVPPRVPLWYFKCLICNRDDCARPEELRAPFCESCVKRMRKAEELPHKCIFCGRTVNSPAKLMFSGICDDCCQALKEVSQYWKYHKRWKHWL